MMVLRLTKGHAMVITAARSCSFLFLLPSSSLLNFTMAPRRCATQRCLTDLLTTLPKDLLQTIMQRVMGNSLDEVINMWKFVVACVRFLALKGFVALWVDGRSTFRKSTRVVTEVGCSPIVSGSNMDPVGRTRSLVNTNRGAGEG